MISGIVSPNSGDILIGGENPNINTIKRGTLSYMPENGGIYESLNAVQNLKIRGRLSRLSKTDIDNQTHSLLTYLKLHKRRKEPVGMWSNGMRKRLALACAIIGNPKFILLDEPTNGVDPQSLELIHKLLKDLNNKGANIIINSHDLNTVQEICSQAIILQEGKVVYEGDVKNSYEELKEFYLEVTEKYDIDEEEYE